MQERMTSPQPPVHESWSGEPTLTPYDDGVSFVVRTQARYRDLSPETTGPTKLYGHAAILLPLSLSKLDCLWQIGDSRDSPAPRVLVGPFTVSLVQRLGESGPRFLTSPDAVRIEMEWEGRRLGHCGAVSHPRPSPRSRSSQACSRTPRRTHCSSLHRRVRRPKDRCRDQLSRNDPYSGATSRHRARARSLKTAWEPSPSPDETCKCQTSGRPITGPSVDGCIQ